MARGRNRAHAAMMHDLPGIMAGAKLSEIAPPIVICLASRLNGKHSAQVNVPLEPPDCLRDD